MSESTNVTWHAGKVTVEERSRLQRQNPLTVWLTGLSASGKSTLACELERRLHDLGHACFVLDGDNIRQGLNRDIGFSAEHRKENIRRIAEVAKLFNDAGIIAIAAFISPYRDDRELARSTVGAERFIEAYLSADINVCEHRDPKGLYKKARAGELADFTGISAPYEAPARPGIHLDTGVLSVEQCVSRLLQLVLQRARDGHASR